MKKLLAITMLGAMIVSLAACTGAEFTDNASAPTTSLTSSTSQSQSSEVMSWPDSSVDSGGSAIPQKAVFDLNTENIVNFINSLTDGIALDNLPSVDPHVNMDSEYINSYGTKFYINPMVSIQNVPGIFVYISDGEKIGEVRFYAINIDNEEFNAISTIIQTITRQDPMCSVKTNEGEANMPLTQIGDIDGKASISSVNDFTLDASSISSTKIAHFAYQILSGEDWEKLIIDAPYLAPLDSEVVNNLVFLSFSGFNGSV